MLAKRIIGLSSGIVVALGLVLLLVHRPHATQPMFSDLAKYGMDVHRASHATPSVSKTRAEDIVKHQWPLPPRTPLMAELVLFKNVHVVSLRTWQLAWLITWTATSYPVGAVATTGGSTPGGGSIIYRHMNDVISAKTGTMLESFPSP